MPKYATILLTNDDGIDAPGLHALRAASEGLGRLIVIAPDGPRSGCGHAVTTNGPIQVASLGNDDFAIDGTPADCIRLALDRLCPEVDLVLSGINAGANLGVDVLHSGTVAAAREAALRGITGIAISQYIHRPRPIDWSRAVQICRRVLAELVHRDCPRRRFWNVNLPHEPDALVPLPDMIDCMLDPSPLPGSYRWDAGSATYAGSYADRARQSEMDIDICFGGNVSISLLSAP